MTCNQASFKDLTRNINEKNNLPGKERLETRFNATNLYHWFQQHDGKEKFPLEKPCLTKDKMKARKKWCEFKKKKKKATHTLASMPCPPPPLPSTP